MPLKIKNVVTGEIKLIEIQDKAIYPTNIWSEVARKDIVQVYERRNSYNNDVFDRKQHERKNVEDILKQNTAYFPKDTPDSDNWNQIIVTENSNNSSQYSEPVRETGNLLHTKTPKKYVAISNIKTTINKYKNHIWTVTIIGGLVVLILGTIILKLAGVIK